MDTLLLSILIHASTMQFEFISMHLLADFPSASSINFYNGQYYLVGDDAKNILVLDKDYNTVSKIAIFNYQEERIAKAEKVDLESSLFLEVGGRPNLILFGSGSKAKRQKMILLPETTIKDSAVINTAAFDDKLAAKGVPEINIEGATVVGDAILLANRGNNANQHNYLIKTTTDF